MNTWSEVIASVKNTFSDCNEDEIGIKFTVLLENNTRQQVVRINHYKSSGSFHEEYIGICSPIGELNDEQFDNIVLKTTPDLKFGGICQIENLTIVRSMIPLSNLTHNDLIDYIMCIGESADLYEKVILKNDNY